jgi:hypothetical protein
MYLTDPLTKEKFIPKRTNQRFSCRKNQINYNNIKARNTRQLKAPFDNILESNRKILVRLIKDKEKIVLSEEFLLGASFNFQFFNRSFEKDAVKYQCVYQFAVGRLENGKYVIYKIS